MKTRIKELRLEKGYSQQALAKELEVSRQTIISLENEKYVASLSLAYKISSFFNKTIEEVFDLKGNL